MKLCPSCDKKKGEDEFSKDASKNDGLRYRCKKCDMEDYEPQTGKVKECRFCQSYYITNSYTRDTQIYCSDKCRKHYNYYFKGQKQKVLEREYRRIENEPQFKLYKRMKSAIYLALKKEKNGRSWEGLVGYTAQKLKEHLEQQFEDGMSWDNYGEWHVDHIIPQSHFNYTTPEDEEFKECWALDNLQPLWAYDNLSKNNRMPNEYAMA